MCFQSSGRRTVGPDGHAPTPGRASDARGRRQTRRPRLHDSAATTTTAARTRGLTQASRRDEELISTGTGDDGPHQRAVVSPSASGDRRRGRVDEPTLELADSAWSSSQSARDDLGHQLAGLGRVQADPDPCRGQARPSCPGRCPCHRTRSRRRDPSSCRPARSRPRCTHSSAW